MIKKLTLVQKHVNALAAFKPQLGKDVENIHNKSAEVMRAVQEMQDALDAKTFYSAALNPDQRIYDLMVEFQREIEALEDASIDLEFFNRMLQAEEGISKVNGLRKKKEITDIQKQVQQVLHHI